MRRGKEARVEVYVVMERGCPVCNALIHSRYFYSLLHRVASAGPAMQSRILNLSYDEDVQEATALWVGLTPQERHIYMAGGLRGTPKTPTIVVWSNEEKFPVVTVAPPITAEEVENYKEISRLAGIALGHALATRLTEEARKRKQQKGQKRGGGA